MKEAARERKEPRYSSLKCTEVLLETVILLLCVSSDFIFCSQLSESWRYEYECVRYVCRASSQPNLNLISFVGNITPTINHHQPITLHQFPSQWTMYGLFAG